METRTGLSTGVSRYLCRRDSSCQVHFECQCSAPSKTLAGTHYRLSLVTHAPINTRSLNPCSPLVTRSSAPDSSYTLT